MKRLLILIMAALLLCTAFTSCGEEEGAPSGFKRASNEACDFDFFVPESWIISQSSGTVAAYCSPADPSSISVMPAELEHADSTVDDWWATHKSDFTSVYSDFTLISETEAILGGIKGKTYVFTGKLGGAYNAEELTEETESELASSVVTGEAISEEEAKAAASVYYFSVTAVVKRSRIYMMTFTSTEELYESHTETLEAVRENFKFH